jgi:hypothetical protein
MDGRVTLAHRSEGLDTAGSSGPQIRTRHKARGWRDVDLARESGVHIDLLRAIESVAMPYPSVYDVVAIVRARECTVEDLVAP